MSTKFALRLSLLTVSISMLFMALLIDFGAFQDGLWALIVLGLIIVGMSVNTVRLVIKRKEERRKRRRRYKYNYSGNKQGNFKENSGMAS